MNCLSLTKKAQVLASLVEGNSIRSTERMTDVHRDTIMRLLVSTGESCAAIMNDKMHNLTCRYIQVDEIWSYVQKKQRHITDDDNPLRVGDQWTFVALDADTKIVPSYLVGKRNLHTATKFMIDLSGRLANRVPISSDYDNSVADACLRLFQEKGYQLT